MLFFFHFFAGIVLGLLLGDLLHDRRWILPCIIVAVLPDLIDKPIGYLFFSDLFGTGRIFMHSVIIVCFLLILGFLFWKYWNHPELLAAAFGILFHQILDQMWENPEGWFFPLFGVSPSNHGADYAFDLLLRDFSTGSEWVFAIAIISAIIVFLVYRKFSSSILQYRTLWAWLMGAGALMFVILAGVTIGTGITPPRRSLFRLFRFIGWDEPVQFILGGIVFLMCALLIWRMRAHLAVNQKPDQ